jgi:hypothetical protein
MIDQTASTVALAKQLLQSLDRRMPTVVLQTPTFELLMRTFIDAVERDNVTARKVEAAHAAFVQSRITGIER